MIQIDPAKVYVPGPAKVHPSVAALLAWRYAQLLAALPKRKTETKVWQELAFSIQGSMEEQPPAGLEEAFGDLHSLQGKGLPRKGAISDVSTRRVLHHAP